VLADAGYGLFAPFRQGLEARGLKRAVGIPKLQKVYPSNVRLVFPIAGRGRPRERLSSSRQSPTRAGLGISSTTNSPAADGSGS
jgi:hypothetical protein